MRTLVKVAMVAALIGAATGTAPALAETSQQEQKQQRVRIATGPLLTWAMALNCGYHIPEQLKLEALMLIRGAYGDEDAITMIKLVKETADDLYSRQKPAQRRSYCREARVYLRKYEE
jgi:hypothetical protein